MNPDTLKRAVELADGWDYFDGKFELPDNTAYRDSLPPWWLDALAAQLVRQVDALDDYYIDNDRYCAAVVSRGRDGTSVGFSESPIDGPYDRTENTINAIVEFAEANPGAMG